MVVTRSLTLLILLVLAEISLSSQQARPAPQPVTSNVVPLKEFPRDKRFETVSGDPSKSGEPYVIRIHAEPGYIIMPHTHPEDENIVVLQGRWALGMGERFNRQALEPMEPGTYGFVSRKMAHFGLSKTETVLQVHGLGPFTTHWVVNVYELTDKGILLQTSAAEAGRPTSTSPPDCFALKIGTHVRSNHGGGVVVAAQCTPGQLTQYRIEKRNGDRFWAQRDELNQP